MQKKANTNDGFKGTNFLMRKMMSVTWLKAYFLLRTSVTYQLGHCFVANNVMKTLWQMNRLQVVGQLQHLMQN